MVSILHIIIKTVVLRLAGYQVENSYIEKWRNDEDEFLYGPNLQISEKFRAVVHQINCSDKKVETFFLAELDYLKKKYDFNQLISTYFF